MTVPLPEFDRKELDLILDTSLPGSVAVVVAPPGKGKSTHTRQAVGHRLSSGKLTRVLWCVQGIREADSLGEEARQAFDALGVTVAIIHSEDHCHQFGIHYRGQFDWSGAPEVKIISHARLPLIFDPGTSHVSSNLAHAELLVIDEDPSGALILGNDSQADGRLAPPLLTGVTGRSAAWDALCAVAQKTQLEDVHTFQQFNGFVRGHGLFGERFWAEFLSAHPAPVDVPAFETALQEAGIRDALKVAQAFARDADGATKGHARPRFGLHWPGAKELKHPAQFRFNLRQELYFDCPVVVLDGYAHETYYQALFAGQSVTLHHFKPNPPLEVECAPMLTVDLIEHGTPRRSQGRKHIAEELARQKDQARSRGQLVLLPKVLTQAGSEMMENIKRAYQAHGLSPLEQPAIMHWHAGRGLNTAAGMDVYALTTPALSSMYQHYTLAALFPDEPEQRERFRAHATGAELLQMLNRGRQPTMPGSPRIIVGARFSKVQATLGDLAHHANLRPYEAIGHFVKGSRNPRWSDMTALLALELLDFFPEGLPKPLLEGLPKHARRGKKALKAHQRLRELAETFLDPGDELYQALITPETWRYNDVPLGGASNDNAPLTRVMKELGLQAVVGLGSAPTVYVPEGGDAEKARLEFSDFLERGIFALRQSFFLTSDSEGNLRRAEEGLLSGFLPATGWWHPQVKSGGSEEPGR